MSLHQRFDGLIIYATPGSGKTYLWEKYDYVIDGDDVLLDIIERISPNFEFIHNCHPVINLRRYCAYNPRKLNLLYKLAEDEFQQKAEDGFIVLTGSIRLMHLADIVYVQRNDRINSARNFDQDREDRKINQLMMEGVLDSSRVKYMNNYLEHYLQYR